MKKIGIYMMALALIVGLFTGCSSPAPKAEKLSVVTTIFPAYDWVREVLGDKVEDVDLTMLLDNGVDLHSYQPTADDMIAISDCDMFVYVGGESDGWVEDALKNATNPDMKVINLVELLGDNAMMEEMVEGMQASEHHHDHDHEEAEHDHEEDHDHEEAEHDHEEDHDHEEAEHDHEEDHDHEEAEHDREEHDHDHAEGETDEHVWLSLKNVKAYVQVIMETLITLDEGNKATYEANGEAYSAKLDALDQNYGELVETAANNTILFGDRFPFRYMVEDYDLDYYAAFIGCSAETEASFETILFLAEKVDELQLPVVLTIEGTEHQIAQTVVDNTTTKDQQVLVLDSMQSTTSKDVANGTTYLSIMEENLEVLKTALQ